MELGQQDYVRVHGRGDDLEPGGEFARVAVDGRELRGQERGDWCWRAARTGAARRA